MNKVTLKNYIPNYLLNPLSNEISKVDRTICLIASIILGVMTAGLLHLLVAGYQWLANRAKDQTRNPNETDQRAANLASSAFSQNSPTAVNPADSDNNAVLEGERPANKLLVLLETKKTELGDIIEQIARVEEDKQYAEILFVQKTTLDENFHQFLEGSIDTPELQQMIIESTLKEFEGLLSAARGILTFQKDVAEDTPRIPSELSNTFNQLEWANNAEKIIRLAKRDYTPKLGEEFKALVSRGEGANTTSAQWVHGTALHSIAKWGKPIEFVAILAECGIDFNRQDGWGNTALIWAIANGRNEMAWELLEYDQDLDIQGHGNSALHLAIAKGYKDHTKDMDPVTVSNFELMNKMLGHGADPNLTNRHGYTALHLACIRRDPDMIEALIQAGADIDIQSPDGKSCAELLETSFEEANVIMRSITPPYLLPEEDFYGNHSACLEFFKQKEF